MVKRSMGICICATTGMSTTCSKKFTSCNCRTSTVLCSGNPVHLSLDTTGMSTTLSENCTQNNVSAWSQGRPQPSMNCTKKTSTTLSNYCNCGTSTVFSTKNTTCTATGMSTTTTTSMKCNCGTSTDFSNVSTPKPPKTNVDEQQLRNVPQFSALSRPPYQDCWNLSLLVHSTSTQDHHIDVEELNLRHLHCGPVQSSTEGRSTITGRTRSKPSRTQSTRTPPPLHPPPRPPRLHLRHQKP